MSVSSSLPWLSILILIAVGTAEPPGNLPSDSQSKSHAKRLKDDLFRDYDNSVRPVRMRSDRTEVAVEMIPVSLAVDEDYDGFTLDAFIKFAWKDEFLTWNASDYGGIQYIRLNGESVWTPEVFHLSSWDITDLRRHSSLCTLYSSGWLHCWDMHSLTALCRLDLTNWPFDSQNCTVNLSTVTQSAEEIDLKVVGAEVSLKEYVPNHTWKLVTLGYNRYSHIFGNRVFPCLQYNFLLRRTDAVTKVKIHVPIIVFVVLLLSSFWLNTEHDVRLNLCCTVFLYHLLLMYEIAHITNGDNTPLLGLFLRDSLVLCVFSLEFSIFMQKLNTASRKSVPEFVNNVIDSRLARIMLGLGRSSSPKQDHEVLSDGGHEIGDNEAPPDSVTRWRLLGTLLNNFFFFLFCPVYLVLLLMYVVQV